MGKLTATAVKAANEPGAYGDGDGLALLVGKTGAKSWIVRVQKDGKRRDIGLGSAAKVSLKLARERAALVRSQIEVGIDRVAERRKAAGIPTFREAAALVHAEHKSGWKNGKHQAQWLATLDAYPPVAPTTEGQSIAVRANAAAPFATGMVAAMSRKSPVRTHERKRYGNVRRAAFCAATGQIWRYTGKRARVLEMLATMRQGVTQWDYLPWHTRLGASIHVLREDGLDIETKGGHVHILMHLPAALGLRGAFPQMVQAGRGRMPGRCEPRSDHRREYNKGK